MLNWLKTFEPARFTAAWTAIVALAATLGIGIPVGLSSGVLFVLGVASILVPLVQAELTRAKVVPTAKVVEATDAPPLP